MPPFSLFMKLKGKVALITGAGSGIGRATAVRFASEGAAVVVTDVSAKQVQEVAARLLETRHDAVAISLDVTSEEQWKQCLAATDARWGKLDILVASAGLSRATPVAEMGTGEWRKVHAVNLDGVFFGARAAVPLLRKSGGGNIVIVSSASGIKSAPGAAAYASSKAALRGLARSIAVELGPDGIRVNTVFPGAVRTPMWSAMPFFQEQVKGHGEEAAWKMIAEGTPLKRVAEPAEIAEGILYLASDAANFVTGAELAMDGGYTA